MSDTGDALGFIALAGVILVGALLIKDAEENKQCAHGYKSNQCPYC